MEQETIKAIADEIANQTILTSWKTWSIQFALWIIGTFGAAYAGAYLAKRGEHRAIKADFNALKSQLEQNTTAVKTIETEIGHADWASREWKTITRTKIEELMRELGALFLWRQQETRDVLTKLAPIAQCPHINNINTLVYVYLPEARKTCQDLTIKFEETRSWLIEQKNLIQAAPDEEKRRSVQVAATEEWKSTYQHITEVTTLRSHCADVMATIMPSNSKGVTSATTAL